MPDLSIEGVHKYWNEYEDKMIYRVVSFMEGVETWTVDSDPAFEEKFKELGTLLDDIGKVDLGQLGGEQFFIKIAANIKAGRYLRFLQSVDIAHPGSASKLLVHAEETSERPDDLAGLFLRRNIIFERLRLLARVFSRERLALVLKAMEGEERE